MTDETYTTTIILQGGPADVFTDEAARSVIGKRIPLMRADGVPLYPEVIAATPVDTGLETVLLSTVPFEVPPGTPPATHSALPDGTIRCLRPTVDPAGVPAPLDTDPTCPACRAVLAAEGDPT